MDVTDHLDHDLVFSTRRACKRNLPDSLTIDHRKGIQGFTRPSLLDPLKYFWRKTPIPILELWFAVKDLSNVMTLHRSVACFRLIFCRVLWSAMETVFRFHRVVFPYTFQIKSFRSSCRPVDRSEIFCSGFCGTPFHNRVFNGIRDCTQKWSLLQQESDQLLGKLTMPVHWMRRTCSRFCLSLRASLHGRRLPPITQRLKLLPPSILCLQTRSQVCELISDRITHVTNVPYPAYVKL